VWDRTETESALREVFEDLADDRKGTFATTFKARATPLAITVEDVGPLTFPVPEAQIRALRAVAEPARFGRGEETVLDRSVRDAWVVPASRLRLGERWPAALAKALGRIHDELGLPQGTTLEPRLQELLFYEEGGHFRPHRDAVKTPAMVATLVVLLPSRFTGGSSFVQMGEREVAVRKGSAKMLTYLAFYADCEHEVRTVESGHRVALVYQLSLAGEVAQTAAHPPALAELLAEHFASPVERRPNDGRRRNRLVVLLEHAYALHGLSWATLKGADSSRARALRSAAEAIGAEATLATVELREHWQCEPDDGRFRTTAGYLVEETDGLRPHPPLVDLLEWELEVTDLVEDDGAPEGLLGYTPPAEAADLSREEGCPPYQIDHEGYQGNWGDTVDRWYRRAAVVLWPRHRAFEIQAASDLAWGLGVVGEHLEAGERPMALQRLEELLPHWRLQPPPELAPDALAIALGMEEPEAAAQLLHGFRLPALAGAPMRLSALADAYGVDWVAARVAKARERGVHRFKGEDGTTWHRALPKLARELGDDDGRRWLREVLDMDQAEVLRDVASALGRPSPMEVEDRLGDLEVSLLALLEAGVTLDAPRLVSRLIAALRPAAKAPPAQAALLSFLRKAKHIAPPRIVERLESSLRRALEDELALPAREPDDWSIDVDLACRCALCRELSVFLRSAQQNTLDWPLAKAKRQHVHQRIDRLELPLTHATLRRGRPYTLRLRKTEALFEEATARRARIEGWLAALT
jgi:hypothetical protein